MPRAAHFALIVAPAAVAVLAGCSKGTLTSLGALSPPNHCVAALGRLVPPGQPVEVWGKKIVTKDAGGRKLRVVTMEVSVSNQRQEMECAYTEGGGPDAVSIRLGQRQVAGTDLAVLNKAVRENQDPGAAFRKRLPSPPNVGRFSIGGSTKRK